MTDDRQAEVEKEKEGGQNIALHIAEKGKELRANMLDAAMFGP